MRLPEMVPGASEHIPVLYQEVLAALNPGAGRRYIDGTLGAGGHTSGLLKASDPDGKVIGIDLDPQSLALCRKLLDYPDRLFLFQGSYVEMEFFAEELGWQSVDGIVLDLGLSSMQLDEGDRGFSFRSDAPLDMRFDPGQPQTAAELVNNLPEGELARILWEYGEERYSRRIARTIISHRPIDRTRELADLIVSVVPGGEHIHPATRTFQALRIAVNDELQVLQKGLEAGVRLLAPGGVMAVISFHSLEDRIVKQFFRQESKDCICPPEHLTCICGHQAAVSLPFKKPVTPEQDEIESNPRARSAKLRVAVKKDLA